MTTEPELLDVHVRGWAPPPKPTTRRPPRRRSKPKPSPWSITVDCETWTDAGQGLRFGTYQVRRGNGLVAQGFFYEPGQLSPVELDTMTRYAKGHGLKVMTREEFVKTELLVVGWKLKGRIIGFNLPFDLPRLAISHDTARPHGSDTIMANAFTLELIDNKYLPRIQLKRSGAHSNTIRFTQPAERPRPGTTRRPVHRGFFNDVATISAALLGESFSLERLCETLQTETRKLERDDHGQTLTDYYLSYGLSDPQATWECHQILKARWRTLGLTTTALHELHSEASVAKADLKQMGITGWRKTQPEFPHRHTAKIMEAYYGGRTESHIRRHPVPVTVVDYTSQYPTVFALQHLWPFLISAGIEMTGAPLAEIRHLLDTIDTDTLLDPATWAKLNVLVKIRPDGDQLPTRARFAPNGALNVAQTIRTGGPEQWFTLADAIASTLVTGTPPHIVAAYRLAPGEPQPGLRSITIGHGEHAVSLDPYQDDLMARLIEQRAHTRNQRDAAINNGDRNEAALLDAQQHALKITANSIYGCTIELNTISHTDAVDTIIVRPNGTTYKCRTSRTEQPGAFFHPAIATLICGGGRLLLALTIELVEQAGGTYAFCDTDSLAIVATQHADHIVATGGREGIETISHDDVIGICEQINSLNPYNPQLIPDLLKIERGADHETWCWSIAAKRYALYTHTEDGIEIVDRKEHGLGHLHPPTENRADFYTQWWQHILNLELELELDPPAWVDQPGLGKLAVTTPRELRNFAAYNSTRPYHQQIRPHGFLTTSHLHPHAATNTGGACLIAPHGTPPEHPQWINRANPTTPTALTTINPAYVIDGHTPVQTLGQLLHTYRHHPEAKTDDSTGQPCGPTTSGELQARQIQATRDIRCGKEANRYNDPTGMNPASTDQITEYPEPLCQHCGANIDHRNGRRFCNDNCRKRHARAHNAT